jgi:hypothetical protein
MAQLAARGHRYIMSESDRCNLRAPNQTARRNYEAVPIRAGVKERLMSSGSFTNG